MRLHLENGRILAAKTLAGELLQKPVPYRPQRMRYIRAKRASFSEAAKNLVGLLLQKIQRAEHRLQDLQEKPRDVQPTQQKQEARGVAEEVVAAASQGDQREEGAAGRDEKREGNVICVCISYQAMFK